MRMQELKLSPEAAGWLGTILYKFLPAGVGAFLMVAVHLPQTKRELFARVFVALAGSLLFTDVLFDFLHSLSWFSFLDDSKKSHVAAVAGLIGACGWFVLGGVSMWLKKFRADPVAAVEEAKKVGP